ncbi:hypothetical protein ACFQ15_02665 [Sphingomonas hankookensis]|uniref:hypothetical protein n=1 Tax=Sphingomonas hankookensis TaxID=563996 RepID=UPI001F5A4E23|nr:hypothetical protein [Sphingomonas hankookensis]
MGQAASIIGECVTSDRGRTTWTCVRGHSSGTTVAGGNIGARNCPRPEQSGAMTGNPKSGYDVVGSCTLSSAYRHTATSCSVTPWAANDQLDVPSFFRHRYFSPGCRTANNDNHDRSDELDQFYTKRSVASVLYSVFRMFCDPQHYQMIDPSAGDGAFYSLLPFGRLGIDLDPKYPGVFAADFLDRDLSSRLDRGKPVAVIGNPPFGHAANLAVKFFKHAAHCADVEFIAFILPLSVRKIGIQNRLDHNFHLVCDIPVPKNAYTYRGEDHDVPTVFQIWERKATPRAARILPTTHPDFCFTSQANADFAIRRNGYHAGRVCDTDMAKSKGYHFIRGRVRNRMARLDFSPFYQNVSGPRSLSQGEIVLAYANVFGTGARRSGKGATGR